MVGLPDVWVGTQGRLGQLKPDIEIPGYLEYADRTFLLIWDDGWLTRRSWGTTCSKYLSNRTHLSRSRFPFRHVRR